MLFILWASTLVHHSQFYSSLYFTASQCKEYIKGAEGNIVSPNFPGGYPVLSDCQWTIEGPLGSDIFLEVRLQVLTFHPHTQTCTYQFVCMGGGGDEDVAQLVEHRIGMLAMQVWFPGAARGFSSRVSCQCRLCYGILTPPCAIACIYIHLLVKDPVVRIRVW